MLGCFKPDFSVLTDEEKKNYKMLHCSMCTTLKKDYGLFETLFLNYDIDFIYLLNNDLKKLKIKYSRCSINPLKKIKVFEGDFSKYIDLNILFIYVSIIDKKMDKEINGVYLLLDKILNKSFSKAKEKIARPIEEEVQNALKSKNELEEVSLLYSNIIRTYLNLDVIPQEFFIEMIKVMYYFDSFKDFDKDKKNRKSNIYEAVKREKVPATAKELIMESIYRMKQILKDNSINEKTLEYSLQSKFNKIHKKIYK